jgi:CPA2 family monovalent cation:H+ antiporter-2
MTPGIQSTELLVVLLAATAIALVFERLRMQAVLGFLLAGAVIGPHGLGVLSDIERIHELAEIGMIFLMLTIGLEFSFKRLQGLKKLAILGGSAQIALSIAISILFAHWMGWTVYQGFVLGSVIALSSTAVVFRNLLDRAELDTQHGRIAVAILVFQDLAVGPLLIFITSFGQPADSMAVSILVSLAKAALLLGSLLIISKYFLPKLMRWIALSRSREIFLLATVLLCFGASWVSARLGLSAALGAFFAGMMLANTDYHYQISGEITPFRHIFVSIFFISIGLLFDAGFVFTNATTVLPMVGLVLLVNWVVITVVVLAFGYPPRVAVITGIILSQIGEFSFLLLDTAKKGSLIDDVLFQNILSAAVITIFLTPFLFNLVPSLMRLTGKIPFFGLSPTGANQEHRDKARRLKGHIVLCGYGTAGQDLAASLMLEKIPFVVVDMNPQNVGKARNHHLQVIYGDAMNEHLLKEVAIEKAKAIVISFGDASSIAEIVRAVRRISPEILIVLRARFERDVAWMYELGADVVVMEELEVSLELTRAILGHFGIEPDVLKTHLDRIRARKEFLVEQSILKKLR